MGQNTHRSGFPNDISGSISKLSIQTPNCCYIIDVLLLVVVVFETFTPNITGKSDDTP